LKTEGIADRQQNLEERKQSVEEGAKLNANLKTRRDELMNSRAQVIEP